MIFSRTVEEWQTVFELEPTLRDVFLEGETDRRLVEGFLRAIGNRDARVRTAAEIDFSGQVFSGNPFCSGNKLRLISFAANLTRCFAQDVKGLTCLIDRDCDVIMPIVDYQYCVVSTDYANLPASFMEYSSVAFCIHTTYGKEISKEFFDNVMEAARFNFALRIYRYSKRPSSQNVALEPSQSKDNTSLNFNKSDLIRRYAIRNNIASEQESILADVTDIFGRLIDNPRKYVNSHDFFALLYNSMRLFGIVKGSLGIEDVKRTFTAAIDVQRISVLPSIIKVIDRLSVL